MAIKSKFGSLRSVQDFFNIKRLSKPQNFSEIQSRISYNLNYFSSNYGIIIGCLSIYTLLTNLLLLFVICFVFLGLLGIGKLDGQDLNTPLALSRPHNCILVWSALLCHWVSSFSILNYDVANRCLICHCLRPRCFDGEAN